MTIERQIKNRAEKLVYFSYEHGILQISRTYVDSLSPYQKGWLTIERHGPLKDNEFEVVVYLEDCFDDPSRRGICLENITTKEDWKKLRDRIFYGYDVDDFAKEIDEKINALELEANLDI